MQQFLLPIGLTLFFQVPCDGIDSSPQAFTDLDASVYSSASPSPEPTPVFVDDPERRVLEAIAGLHLSQTISDQVVNRCCADNSEVFLVADGEQLKPLILHYTLNRDESTDPRSRCLILPAQHYELEAGLWLKRADKKTPVTLEICGIHDLVGDTVIPGDVSPLLSATPASYPLTASTALTPEPTPFPEETLIDQSLMPEDLPEPEKLSRIRFTKTAKPGNWRDRERLFYGLTHEGSLRVRFTGLFMDFSLHHLDGIIFALYSKYGSELEVLLSYIRSESKAVCNYQAFSLFKSSTFEANDSPCYYDEFGSLHATGCTFFSRGAHLLIDKPVHCFNKNSIHLSDSRLIGLSSQITTAVRIKVDICADVTKPIPPVIRSVHFYGGSVPVSLYPADNSLCKFKAFNCSLTFENSTGNYWHNVSGEYGDRGCHISPGQLLRGQIEFQEGIVCGGTEASPTAEPATLEPPASTVSTTIVPSAYTTEPTGYESVGCLFLCAAVGMSVAIILFRLLVN